MHYRKMGNIDEKLSALGFGAMRFPTLDDDNEIIDAGKATEMLDYALNHGVNYIDTAWPYHGGNSEEFVGNYLTDLTNRENGPDLQREDLYIATKLPVWLVDSLEDADEYLEKQLNNLQTEYIDFFLLHALDYDRWDDMKKIEIVEWLKEKKAEGKVKYIGFSFHDELKLFKEIVDYSDAWDFCQIQYNYIDLEYQAGKEGMHYAADKGLGVIIMEPLRGGLLARKPPEDILDIWKESEQDISPAARALQWLWDQEDVGIVLSGMNKLSEVKENIETAIKAGGINTLPKKEIELVEKAGRIFKKLAPVDCTGCNYCMPCPESVWIPRVFDYYNQAHIYDNYKEMSERYFDLKEENRADNCIACLVCEDKCPQDLPISELMIEIDKYFSKAK